jgi:hypothetical protein
MGCLYKLDFASGKSYVGMTEKSMSQRMTSHRRAARGKSQYAVYRAWRKYGEPKPRILAFATGEYLFFLEEQAVRAYGTYGSGGYNLTPGGHVNPMHTPEGRAKLSESKQDAPPRSAEWCAKLSAALTGKKPSEETRVKLRARRASSETCAKRSAALMGHPVSDETRAKISASHMGIRHSPEALVKISEASLKMWAARRASQECVA